MKILSFRFRGEEYQVNEFGQIKANGLDDFSNSWLFLGGHKHHWAGYIGVPLAECFKHPEKLNGCLGWDRDHGTLRRWGGRYNGKLPRITSAHITMI